VSSSDGIA